MPATKTKGQDRTASTNGKLTHPERVLFPDTGLTKLGLANYYAQIAEWMLPQLVDRPLSLLRCPEGQAAGKCFFQKHPGPGTPKALGRVEIEEKEGPEEYVYVRDVEGLLALVQMSVLEIHPWGAKRDNVERPDRLTFDLDPGPDVPWERVIEAALEIRKLLERIRPGKLGEDDGREGTARGRADCAAAARVGRGQAVLQARGGAIGGSVAEPVHDQHVEGPAEGKDFRGLSAERPRGDGGRGLFDAGAEPGRRFRRRWRGTSCRRRFGRIISTWRICRRDWRR